MQGKPERSAPLEMSGEEFRLVGHKLVEDIAEFLDTIASRKVNPAQSPHQVQTLLGTGSFPANGESAGKILAEASRIVLDNSLLNGHPSFYGYITSSAAPIGALGDLLGATANPNVGSFQLAPVGTEIEAQTIRWIAEAIGYRADAVGILSSGGNMANFICFVAARRAKASWNIRKEGIKNSPRLCVYTSTETHTWIQKAADIFGLGTDAIRWIPTDAQFRMDTARLRAEIERDKANGDLPCMAIGTAGSVATGAIDPLEEIGSICKEHDLWFHIDGAYGGFAAILPDAPHDLRVLSLADSVAVDPHKWLYAPLEAGCALVRDKSALLDAFAYHPAYYKFDLESGEMPVNFYELGPQNSRGFRALKVWLGMRQAGREGYIRMISDDCALSREMFAVVDAHPELEALTQGLSITTFRYRPPDLDPRDPNAAVYLNELNEALLSRIQNSGEAYVSNAVLNGTFVLRACIVNFRTDSGHVRALPELAVKLGRELDRHMRKNLKPAETCFSKP